MPTNKAGYITEYYKNNKDKFKQYFSQKIHCEHCNKEISKCNWKTHENTKKHRMNTENNNQT